MIKIAITGPESSGKSFLANQLTNYYHATLIQEYSRTYLDSGSPYNEEDLLNISEGQANWYKEGLNTKSDILISDTEMLVMKIWYEEKFGKSNMRIEELFLQQDFDLYLLTKPDIPWTPDPLRENPNDRDRLFNIYSQYLKKYEQPFKVVSGSGETRLKEAISFIDALL